MLEFNFDSSGSYIMAWRYCSNIKECSSQWAFELLAPCLLFRICAAHMGIRRASECLWHYSLCRLSNLRPRHSSLPHSAFQQRMSECDAEPGTLTHRARPASLPHPEIIKIRRACQSCTLEWNIYHRLPASSQDLSDNLQHCVIHDGGRWNLLLLGKDGLIFGQSGHQQSNRYSKTDTHTETEVDNPDVKVYLCGHHQGIHIW